MLTTKNYPASIYGCFTLTQIHSGSLGHFTSVVHTTRDLKDSVINIWFYRIEEIFT